MKTHFLLTIVACITVLSACKQQPGKDLLETEDFQKLLQEKFIQAKNGDIIELPEGNFLLSKTLVLEGLNDITIRGRGMDKTVLSFKGQEEGAEGIYISNVKNITLEGFSIQDAKGDNIKIKDAEGVVLRKINSTWTGGAKETNGAYALYPVESRDVLVEDCEVSYASDAGIYVGQSTNVVVRRCYAHHNVAGIEIENCINSDVYENKSISNTGGILVFDLPNLPQANGRNARIFNNEIRENNHKNFAAPGNIVAIVPPGSGVIVLATDSVDIFNNQIIDHKSIGVTVASYQITQKPIEDSAYGPYSSTIYIRDNTIKSSKLIVDMSTDLGKMLFATYRKPMDIVYDGFMDQSFLDENGAVREDKRICIRNNGDDIRFGNLHAAKAKGITDIIKIADTDITPFDCAHNGITGRKTPVK